MHEEHISKMVKLVASTVRRGAIIGLGSGSTVAAFVKALSETEVSKSITVVPSSMQIETVALEAGLKVGGPQIIKELEWVFDGADQVDKRLNIIKGGGGALFRERILLSAAKHCVIMVDENKVVERLNKPLPIEASPFARWYVKDRLEAMGGKVMLRADKKGYPTITENGNIIFDVDFGEIGEPQNLHYKIKDIAGVIDTGLFILKSPSIYVARLDGSIYRLDQVSLC
ncbi:MAG: ribose 5-phosphate isomerase A [Nitrososphaerales archaeon]